MAHYLLTYLTTDPVTEDGFEDFTIVEAESAKAAVDDLGASSGIVNVYALRDSEPRTFEISVETQKTIIQI